MKVNRNEPCPCGEPKKFKKCCAGTTDWELIYRERPKDVPLYLSARGKNLAFLNVIADALQLNDAKGQGWSAVKKACTPRAVVKIHEAIVYLWPSEADLRRVLLRERKRESGLYVGHYAPETILRGVSRHAIYSDRIILFNPFTDPRLTRSEFNPIDKPEAHQIDTLRWSWLWLQMAPWIDEGLVEFIASPEAFDLSLARESLRISSRQALRPELAGALSAQLEAEHEESPEYKGLLEFVMLSYPDERLREMLMESAPSIDRSGVDRFMRMIAREREQHPYYIDRSHDVPRSDFIKTTTGTNFYVAKLVANFAGAHLITDLPYRWKEIELDRKELGVGVEGWTPFAKAFQNANFRCLDQIPLAAILRLRREERLAGMRAFLRRAWRAARSPDSFSEANGQALADELDAYVREAEEEWREIDRDLVKVLSIDMAAALAGSRVVPGQGAWLAGGAVVAGLGALGVAWHKRKHFPDRYPAAFFLDLKRRTVC